MSSILINHRPHDSTRSALLPPTLLSPLLDPNSPHTHLRPQLLLSPSAKRSRRRPRHRARRGGGVGGGGAPFVLHPSQLPTNAAFVVSSVRRYPVFGPLPLSRGSDSASFSRLPTRCGTSSLRRLGADL